MTALDGHQFWADDLSGVTGGSGDTTLVRSHRDVTTPICWHSPKRAVAPSSLSTRE
jgi:hypothetical protein